MNKLFFCLCFFVVNFAAFSQSNSLWKEVSATQKNLSDSKNDTSNSQSERLYSLNFERLNELLQNLQSNNANSVLIEIPNTQGIIEQFTVVESSNFDATLQAQFPAIRAYSGVGITDANAVIHFSTSPQGMKTMVLRGNSGSEFIDPLSVDKSIYVVSRSKTRKKGELGLNCKTVDFAVNKELTQKVGQTKASNAVFKTLRLALSCTGEYAQYFGGTKELALAGMNATMTRVNGVFNRDLAVKLIFIANQSAIIYTNPAADPYSDAEEGVGDEYGGTWNSELQTTLTSVIGNGNYDIGHLFGASGGGGDAGCIGCVCVNPTTSVPNGKGSAFTSPSNDVPEGDAFDIDFVAHEMAHQLGANHTFSFDVEGTGVSVEPGSGSTIMGYAGITDYNVQNSSDDYFAYASIKQIQDNLATKSCPVSTSMTSQTPSASAGNDYTIPKGTAFVLNGTASDPNGDTMTYCWEQNDSATYLQTQDNSLAYASKPNGPLFRSFMPNSVTNRYFPALERVLVGQLSTSWESVSNVSRNLNFVFTARDNAASGLAQTSSDGMVITVDSSKGPFEVTSQNSSSENWILGSLQTITWNVNNTNTLSGASYVNIRLSTDGGVTFPTYLATNTLNDGSEVVTTPLTAAKNCRILIEPTANVFYAVNSSNFAIGYSVETNCNTYEFSTPYTIPESLTYAESTIVIPATATSSEMSDVNFNVTFTHEYISDVQIEVVSPSGTTVKLFDNSCSNNSGSMILTYDDLGTSLGCGVTTKQVVVPATVLSAFNGENPQGTWKLRYRDIGVGDSGTIDAASIEICSSIYTTLSVQDNQATRFLLSPNPNKGKFTVLFNSMSANEVLIYVTDLSGRRVYQKSVKNTGQINEVVELLNTATGTYIVTIVDGDRKENAKIIIQ